GRAGAGQEVGEVVRAPTPLLRVEVEEVHAGRTAAAFILVARAAELDERVRAGMVVNIIIGVCGTRRAVLELTVCAARVVHRVRAPPPGAGVELECVHLVAEVALVSATEHKERAAFAITRGEGTAVPGADDRADSGNARITAPALGAGIDVGNGV